MEMDGGPRWSAQAADLIHWFEQRRAEFPAIPFHLNAWTHVSDPATFYASLNQDIACGPLGTRAGAVIGDLEDLFAWWASSRE